MDFQTKIEQRKGWLSCHIFKMLVPWDLLNIYIVINCPQRYYSIKSKLFFALNIGKCDLKKNYEEKSYPHLSFFREKKIYLNSCDFSNKNFKPKWKFEDTHE